MKSVFLTIGSGLVLVILAWALGPDEKRDQTNYINGMMAGMVVTFSMYVVSEKTK